ncbi:MAG: hypothetical protein JRF17_01345 [Deltaproteobacteria bacterium]|jgi:hypothetical protein|nr:hypothetical protein [Deltaproteobacteria bacterium]MBW2489670.1 hypothetical protein [Deltaproteobacteria bacterium]
MDWIQFVYLVTQVEKPAAELMKILDDIPFISCIGFSEQITGEPARELGNRKLILKQSVEEQAG